MFSPTHAAPIAASYADWNLVLGLFVAVTTLAFAVLGVFLVRRIVQEDRHKRRLDDRLTAQADDTRLIRDRLSRAPFERLSELADTLRRAGVLVGDPGVHAGRRQGRSHAYLEADPGFAPFDAPSRIEAALRDGKTLEVRPADPRVVAEAKRAYVHSLRIVHDLYKAAFHVARRNEVVIEDIDALHRRMHVLKRSLIGGAVALAALVALPLGLVVAVPTRPLNFHLIDVSITLFAARMILLGLFVSGTAATTWLLWRALDRIDLTGLRYSLVRDHRSPRAFDERLRHQDARREARLRALDAAPTTPAVKPVPATTNGIGGTAPAPGPQRGIVA